MKNKLQSKSVKNLVGVLNSDRQGRPVVMLVPGSNGKRYHVIARRIDSQLMTCECRLDVGRNGFIDCQGNGHRKGKEVLCKHSQWAVQYCIELTGMEQAWCESYEDALKLNQIKKGKVIEVCSHQASGRMWVVVNQKNQLKLL